MGKRVSLTSCTLHERSVKSPFEPSVEPSVESPVKFSDWEGFSNSLSFDSTSDTFTDNNTDSEAEGINTSWLYSIVEEQDQDTGYRRYLSRLNHYIQERDKRRIIRELKEVDYFDDDDFNRWTTKLE